MVDRLQQAIHVYNPLLVQQLASTTMLDEMHSVLSAGDVEGDGFTPLIYTCFEGHVALVRLLLDAGADKRRQTTVMYSTAHGVQQRAHRHF